MSQGIFSPTGKSYIVAYADDSTDTSLEVPGAQAVSVFNPDAANVVAVNFSFVETDTNASIPLANDPGLGTVIGPGQQLTLTIPQAAYVTPMYISVAGVSATGNVYISVGSIQ